ncbi:TauD/TfdA dioxygenase family protein [Actinokineospora sp. NPDC004072]
MTSQAATPTRIALEPFGQVVTADGPADLRDIPPATLERWTIESKVTVLRGFPLLAKDELIAYAGSWGEILRWDFGEVLDLVVQENPSNYLFARGDVPFHWDGAFAAATPRFFLFQCVRAPRAGGGGETVFCDTTAVIERADAATRERWASVSITYRTDKVEHYGGRTTAALLATHPATGAPIIRYAEPLPPGDYLNPLFLTVSGIPEPEVPAFLADLRERLHAPEVCYHHQWRDGDIVVVDNHALVHGRNAFRDDPSRHLQRIQIL